MPNGTLEKALLPGWPPDAMQLIHFYSREQVSHASQAAPLKTTLFILPQAPGKPEGIGHNSVPAGSTNAFRVPHGAAAQHLAPLHRPVLTRAAGWALGTAAAPGRDTGPWVCPRLACFGAAGFRTGAANAAAPVALRPGLRVHEMESTAAGPRGNSFFPVLSSDCCARAAQTRTCRSRACPAAAGSAAGRGELVPAGRKRKISAAGAGDRKGQRVSFPPPERSNMASGTWARNPVQTHSSRGCAGQTAPRKGALPLPPRPSSSRERGPIARLRRCLPCPGSPGRAAPAPR